MAFNGDLSSMPTKRRRKMHDYLISFYESLPIARTIYSVILLGIIFVLASEMMSVWRQGKIFISDFSYFSSGKKNAEYAEQLRSETIANYAMIVGFMKADRFKIERDNQNPEKPCQPVLTPWYKRILGIFRKEDDTSNEQSSECGNVNPNNFDTSTINNLINSVRTEKVNDIAKTLDVTVQGINLKGLLTAFGNLVAPPQTQIIASIYETGGKKRTYVSVVGDSKPRREQAAADVPPLVSSFDAPGSDPQDAFNIACYLIWIQVSKAKDDSDRPKMSFEEFCDWAKVLSVKNALETADPYRMEARKKTVDLDFIRQEVALATRLEISFRDTYASISGLEKFVGSEPVKLTEQIQTNVDSVADLIRYFVVARVVANYDSDRDWLKGLPATAMSREIINAAYFKSRISTDSQPNPGIGKNVLKANVDIVRIFRTLTDARTGNKRQVITTGLLFADGQVLTIYSASQDNERLRRFFANALVRPTQSGGDGKLFEVQSASFAVPVGESPYVILSVPDLKRQADLPPRDFRGFDTSLFFSGITVAGNIRDTALTFAGQEAVRRSDTEHTDNDRVHLLSGTAVAEYARDFTEDKARRVYLSVPFSPGLLGSPIYDESAKLVGFVEGGFPIGKNLLLAIGVSIAPLKNYPQLKNKATDDD
jgi:hypothetical protein